MATMVFDSIRTEMERFIQLKTEQMKQEMLLIMDAKLNELRKQLGSMDSVEWKETYLPKSGVSSLGDDRLHVHELERVNMASINSCIDQLYVESITSLNHDTLQQHFALPSPADHCKENAAVPPKASQKDAKPISLKSAKNAKPLAEINGQVEHHRAKAATRKQVLKKTASTTDASVKRAKRICSKESVKEANENVSGETAKPSQPKRKLSQIFKNKIFGANDKETGGGSTVTDQSYKPRTTRRMAKLTKEDVKEDNKDGEDDDDQPRSFALTRNMWERRSLKD